MNKQRQMSDEYIIQELAKIEGYGYDYASGVVWSTFDHGSQGMEQEPLFNGNDYLNSHDAIQRLIDGMSDGVGKNAVRELAYVVGLYKDTNYSLADIDKMNNATPEQKAEAVLKAYGRWTTTEEGL